MNAPLAGLKVVELAHILPRPWIDQTSANLGTKVIKVETRKVTTPARVALPLSTVKTINQPPIFIVLTVKDTALPSILGMLPIW